jgi:hypothetical protein
VSIVGIVSFVWPFVWKYGIGATILAAALALLFLTTFKKTALTLIVAAVVGFVLYTTGVHDGKQYIQARWNAEEKAMVVRGAKARDEAELAVPHDVAPDPPRPGGSARRVCLDRFDRDCK